MTPLASALCCRKNAEEHFVRTVSPWLFTSEPKRGWSARRGRRHRKRYVSTLENVQTLSCQSILATPGLTNVGLPGKSAPPPMPHYYPLKLFWVLKLFLFLFLHNEILWRNCFVQFICCTSAFWKCIWFEYMGRITKVTSVKRKNVTWRICPLFLWNCPTTLRMNRCRFLPLQFKNSFLQRVCLLRIVKQRVKVRSRFLLCSGVKGHLSRNSYAGPAIWRENHGAKLTSSSHQKFPTRMSEAKWVKTTLPHFSFLTAADLTPKEDFEQLFIF